MSADGSVSHWIDRLKAGDPAAAEQLWERYFRRLVGLARLQLRGRRPSDGEEDVALSAFASFCRGVAHGRFPQLGDRDNLWRLLVVLTSRKASHLRRDEGRQKRAPAAASPAIEDDLERIVGREPTPAFAAQIAEECQRLLRHLDNPELEAVARWKMEGYTNPEIAEKLGCAPRSVERKLHLIRGIWEKEARDD